MPTEDRRRRHPRLNVLAAASTAAALLIAGCSPAEEDDPQPAPPEPEETPAEPAIITDDDGFRTSTTLPEPVAERIVALPGEDGEETAKLQVVSLDSDGDFARLVYAWLAPETGSELSPQQVSPFFSRSQAAPWMRLIDRGASEVIAPLRADGRFANDGAVSAGAAMAAAPDPEPMSEEHDFSKARINCVCSSLPRSAPRDGVALVYIDFPAPESDEIDLFFAEWAEPLRGVPVTAGTPFELPEDDGLTQLTPRSHEMSGQYGTGAVSYDRQPLSARSESLSGVSTTIAGESQEVSLPADVLFEFGESELSADAEQVIEDAAEKLNAEAAGQTVVIEGHTDNIDSHEVNQRLSEDRAEAVAEAITPLLDDGISVETEGHSYDRPLAPNQDAEGNDLPENRELNRRVSFRYTATEDSGHGIDLGAEELQDLDEAEQTQAEPGALASYVLPAPEEDETEHELRFDVLGAERDGMTVTMRFALGLAGTGYEANAFRGSRAAEDPQLLGKNAYSGGTEPGLGNLGLVDVAAGRQYFPVSAPSHCVCSEVLATGRDLPDEGTPAFAEFELPPDLDGPLILRIPDSAQIELPQELVAELTAGTD
ncbi:OmpA family protein [Sediminivirga luteola]|uniref:OmpA-like domain-containing protein n=1 Tax=Sediminivirga luteola TaxID=1774748 RepID=A0A8J2XJ73_9MICO|nr:OmpA family protein [Sediminivirga luteola]GGA19002.1 hypothetical protein GCM10011333_22690 [Sediminivirga luteola]